MLIIPDVHGRQFWRKAVETAEEGEEILFLGDYLDPYPDEGISEKGAIEGLRDIIALKKERPGEVTLLLGNHDIHYEYLRMGGGRTDYVHMAAIKTLFADNRDLFDIAAAREVAGRTFWFTHAGILKGWVQENYGLFSHVLISEIPDMMNRLFHESDQDRISLFYALSDVSYARWGSCIYGSPVWADAEEDHNPNDAEFDGVYQIFGHTQLREEVILTHWACLDCRKAFRLTDEGNIEKVVCSDN